MTKIKPSDGWASVSRRFVFTNKIRASALSWSTGWSARRGCSTALQQAMRTALRMIMLDGLDLRAVVRVFSAVEGFAEILLVERLPTPRLGVA